MKEFLIEALNSRVGERLVDCLFVCVIVVAIQYSYNKKLTEYQIRFEYWHKEKAKAIKTLFKNFAELSLRLNHLLTCEEKDDGSEEAMKKKAHAIRSLASITIKSFENGVRLSLFLDKKNDDKIKELLMKVNDFSELYNPNINNFSDALVEQGKTILAETKKLLGELRTQFRDALMVQEDSLENEKEKTQVEKGKKA